MTGRQRRARPVHWGPRPAHAGGSAQVGAASQPGPCAPVPPPAARPVPAPPTLARARRDESGRRTVSVEWPGLLWTLLLVPVALAAYLLAQRRRSRYTVRFTNLDLLANVVSVKPGWRRHVPPAFYLLALAALVVSLARPQALALVPKDRRRSSWSWTCPVDDATDVRPTRLISSQRARDRVHRAAPGQFRVGIVSFASTARLADPDHRPPRLQAVARCMPEGRRPWRRDRARPRRQAAADAALDRHVTPARAHPGPGHAP